jgi:hypothetical protein
MVRHVAAIARRYRRRMDVSPMASGSRDLSAGQNATAAAFGALLFREILKPLAAVLGPAGDVVLDRVVDGTFVRPQR